MAQEVTVTRTLTFNLSRYEQMTTTVTITGLPLGIDPEVMSQTLDDKMAAEVARAVFATVKHPDDNDTSVYSWEQIIKEGLDA